LIEKKYGIKITDPKKAKEAFTSVRTIAQFISDNKQ